MSTPYYKETIRKCEFTRDWRNRHIAHRDLGHALDKHAVPLASASRKGVREALEAIVNLLNHVEQQQCGCTTFYDGISPHGNAESLLCVLRDGVNASSSRRRRLSSGNPLRETYVLQRRSKRKAGTTFGLPPRSVKNVSRALVEARRAMARGGTPALTVPGRPASPSNRDGRAESPPLRVRGRTHSSRTPTAGAALPT